MRDLIILGTGVHAAEMAEIVERVNHAGRRWNLIGYITADIRDAGTEINGVKVIGTLSNLADYPDTDLIADNAWPRDAEIPRERLVSLVDPTAFVSRTAVIGAGSVLYPHCYVGLEARVGEFVFCLSGCAINHESAIGDRTVMATGVTLAGNVTVESDCYLGQSATVRQYLRIGAGSLVGMGSVVVKDVPPGSVVAGNPARYLRAHRRG